MLSYVYFGTNDLERATRFYDATLALLGMPRCVTKALANGGSSDGAPGLRLDYAADFYAAYVRDPDGNKLAAVCRGRRAAAQS